MTTPMGQARLAICTGCPFNVEGTCAMCGCNIAEKVEKIEESCPHTPPLWHSGTGFPISAANTINRSVCIPCNQRKG